MDDLKFDDSLKLKQNRHIAWLIVTVIISVISISPPIGYFINIELDRVLQGYDPATYIMLLMFGSPLFLICGIVVYMISLSAPMPYRAWLNTSCVLLVGYFATVAYMVWTYGIH
ncbi:MAG: hypothetical protein AB2535_18935 [Candidatus Thiodiazotropha endolucinida]